MSAKSPIGINDRPLLSTSNTLANFLEPIRTLIVKIISYYFSIVPLPATLKEILKNCGTTVVVAESSSLIIEALLLSFAKRSNLLGTQNLNRLKEFTSSEKHLTWVSLHSKDKLANLLETPIPLTLVTLNVFSGRGPFKNNPQYNLGFWDLTGILVLGRFLIIFFGKPVPLTKNGFASAASLVRTLRVDFYKNLKLVRGTPFHTIERQEDLVIGTKEFNDDLTQLSEKLATPVSTLKRQAKKAFYDIAANPKRPMYRIVAFCARLIINRLFSSVRTVGLDNLENAVKESTAVIVPMHRSHLDYIIIGSTLYQSHLNPPLVAAGINLSFWPIGFIIRSVGGYFVKRNVRNDRLHALILKRYVSYLVRRGHLQEFFIEGGRSRSGRMRQPKLGLLNVFLDAHLQGYKRDIVFIPTSITYENVIESTTFGKENTGRSKEKENLWSLLKASAIFKQKYGDVVINFGKPISLQDFLAQTKVPSPARHESRSSATSLGSHLTRSIRDQTNPSLTSLVHTALLMAPRYGLSRSELIHTTRNLGKILQAMETENSQVGQFTPSLKMFMEGGEHIISDVARGDSVQIARCGMEDGFFIRGERRFTADFYRNSTLHLFLPISFLAVLHLLGEDLNAENIQPFYSVFSFDLILGEKQDFSKKMELLIQKLKMAGIVEERNGKYVFINLENGIFIPSLILSNIESILWVSHMLHYLSKHGQVSEQHLNDSIEYELLITRLQNEFRTAVYLGKANCTEAASSANLVSALDTLNNIGLISINERHGKRSKIIVRREGWNKLDALRDAQRVILRWQQDQLIRRP